MRLAALAPAFLLTIVSVAAVLTLALQPPREAGVSVAVLYAPGTPLIDAVSRVVEHGGTVERTGKWENLIVASFGGREAPVEALTDGGAWLVFDALLAGGCGLLNPDV